MKIVQAIILIAVLLFAVLRTTLFITICTSSGKELFINLFASLIFCDYHVQQIIKKTFAKNEPTDSGANANSSPTAQARDKPDDDDGGNTNDVGNGREDS